MQLAMEKTKNNIIKDLLDPKFMLHSQSKKAKNRITGPLILADPTANTNGRKGRAQIKTEGASDQTPPLQADDPAQPTANDAVDPQTTDTQPIIKLEHPFQSYLGKREKNPYLPTKLAQKLELISEGGRKLNRSGPSQASEAQACGGRWQARQALLPRPH
jgi:hypothetical protein